MIRPESGVELLTETTVVAHLRGRGLLGTGPVTVEALGGGVSNVVLAVSGPDGGGLVVKQALPRLRVAEEWTAPTGRTLTEAAALLVAARVTPDAVPPMLDTDEHRHVLVQRRAPAAWRDWKSMLLGGTADPELAARLGELLAAWHSATTDVARLPQRVADGAEAFEQLRIDPYYRSVARQVPPELGRRILAAAEALGERRRCLVHGDFSPKNVLVAPAGTACWVIDFEVAHPGDPVFDLAFLLCHLALKSVHRPAFALGYGRCMTAFAARYEDQVDPVLAPSWPDVLRHVGCLLLARVRGKSPAEYLGAAEWETAWRLGTTLLIDDGAGATGVGDLQARLAEVLR